MQQKCVAIIGAGPAGLVAAKYLLKHPSNLFKVSIFDSKQRLGGLWAVDDDDPRGASSVDPSMRTNGSKFTVAFSDLAWSSVDLSNAATDWSRGTVHGLEEPMFPKAWMVRSYLETYADRFIATGCLRLGHQVTALDRIGDADVSTARWRLSWKVLSTTTNEEGVFDYVVIATGFFSKPRPVLPILGKADISPARKNIKVKAVHSSKLNDLTSIFGSEIPKQGVVLVKGSGMSGAEAAAKVAAHISDINNSLHPTPETGTELRVIHVISRQFYAVPLYVPRGGEHSPRPSFSASDIVFYDTSRRADSPIIASVGLLTADKANMTHSWLRNLLGAQRSRSLDGNLQQPPRVCICPSYDIFLQSGAIELFTGELSHADDSNNGSIAMNKVTETGRDWNLEDVVAIVDSAGYTSSPAVEFLSKDVLSALEFDESVERLPLILEQFQTSNPKVPHLGFVGFYEAPYWGVMEMQARLLACSWASPLGTNDLTRVGPSMDAMRTLRRAISDGNKQVPQFWMGDYIGIMEETCRAVGLQRDQSTPLTIPAAYTDMLSDTEQSKKAIEQLHDVMEDGSLFIPEAAFRAMQGQWKIHRNLESALEGFPTGSLDGIAHFHPRQPTATGFDGEYLYIEVGSLVTHSGLTMAANRRYVYRFSEMHNQISVWFVKDDGLTVDYQFHTLNVDRTSEGRTGGWLARADHLCVEDMYNTTYEWLFDGVGVKTFRIQHSVKGPKKDYVSDTSFERSWPRHPD